MDTVNNNPTETESTPASVPAPAATVPVAAAAPAVTATPAVTAAPAPVAVAPAVTPAPAPVEIFRGVIPQTKGSTPGSWNRFAGYNPNDAKNKQKDGRGGSKGRR